MYDSAFISRTFRLRRQALLVSLALLVLAIGNAGLLSTPWLWAQDESNAEGQPGTPEGNIPNAESTTGEGLPDVSEAESAGQPDRLRLIWLINEGGPLMIPIGLMSVFVVGLIIERLISLRRAKIMPPDLIRELGQATDSAQGFDPRQVYRLCQRYPSATSTVIRAMLLKVGRPHSEVEHAVAEASEREADRLYANVRWLNLAASISPLLGLFGTVWGMIRAFFDTTHLQVGQNKADYLATGIYVALVTTLGGLAVAIPAAIFAHYFEGRIQALFHRIDELLFNLLPQVERYEGRLRVSRQSLSESGPKDAGSAAESKLDMGPPTHTTRR